MLEIDLDRFILAMDYIEGKCDHQVSVGELALLLELISPDGLTLTIKEKE